MGAEYVLAPAMRPMMAEHIDWGSQSPCAQVAQQELAHPGDWRSVPKLALRQAR